MALSNEDIKNMAKTVIESADGPLNLGGGQQINPTSDNPVIITGSNTTVVDGDNTGGIRLTFGR
ncbi:hypothetical protein ACSCBZ_41925 [Streptomyces niveiscabiei]|uniref:hypothetical protein n=1 Tax=Streptomyces niveiscabiei TaxID=164115 RepID=UPI0006EB9B78|nr:hypothetical protein [Streptomyces niveiscabiei]